MELDLYSSVLLAITFLSVAVLASLALKAIRFPYTIGLMVIGLGLGALLWAIDDLAAYRSLVLSPEIILYLVLPTLIFEASMNIDARLLFRNLVPIALLAVLGLLISTLVVAFGLAGVTTLPLAATLLFGALISATDPVAVIALFKEIGAPRRLVTLIDGESLFNDATAIVLFTVLAAAVGMSGAHTSDPSVFGGAVQFILVLLGGLAVGGLIGWAGSWLIQVDKGNFLFQIAVSFIMAYLSFLVADHAFHFSGVMSSLAAGLMLRYRAETAFRRHHIHTLEQVWELLSFVANSFVFILLGLTAFSSARSGDLSASLGPVLWSLPIVLLARFLSIVLLIPPYNALLKARKRSPIPWNYQAILFWGGLRGAVPVALVLAIPESFPNRDVIVHLTFGIILFTLLVQGTTVKKLMDWLGVRPDGSPFADRATLTTQYVLPDERLASLVQDQVQRGFESEGFLAESGEGETALFLRKGSQMFTLERRHAILHAECEPRDAEYLALVVQEALLFLKSAVGSIEEAVGATGQVTLAEDQGTQGAYPVLRALKPVNIVLDLRPGTKEEVIGSLVRRLAENGDLGDSERVLADILERERSMTTGLGKGIATPHAKTDQVERLVLALGLCREGTDFSAFDGQPSRYFALILSPRGEEGPHLKVLSMMTGLLNRQALRDGLDAAATPEEVYRLVRDHAMKWW